MARLEVDVCGYCGLISGVMRVGDLWQGRWYCSDECKHAAEVAAVMAQSDDMRQQLEDAHVQLRDALTQREEMRLHREDMRLQLLEERLQRVEDRQQLYDTRQQLEDTRMQLENARRQLRRTLHCWPSRRSWSTAGCGRRPRRRRRRSCIWSGCVRGVQPELAQRQCAVALVCSTIVYAESR